MHSLTFHGTLLNSATPFRWALMGSCLVSPVEWSGMEAR